MFKCSLSTLYLSNGLHGNSRYIHIVLDGQDLEAFSLTLMPSIEIQLNHMHKIRLSFTTRKKPHKAALTSKLTARLRNMATFIFEYYSNSFVYDDVCQHVAWWFLLYLSFVCVCASIVYG